MTTARLFLDWSDAYGRPARHTLRVSDGLEPDAPSLVSGAAALASLSRCSLDRCDLSVESSYADESESLPAGGGALVYAVFLFRVSSLDGSRCGAFSFPDPTPDLFDSRGFIDPDFPGLSTIVSRIQSCCTDENGNAFGDFLYGYRSSTKDGI